MIDVFWLEQTAADVPSDHGWLSANEADRLQSLLVPKRRDDWRLGRWTAKRAVAGCLNMPHDRHGLSSVEIRAAASGAPEAFVANQPVAVTISISHRSGLAICAIAPSGGLLGCDLEVIEARSNAFAADYFTAEEQRVVARAPLQDHARLLTLLWSAKESALKALREGLRLDTRCVSVSLDDWYVRSDGGAAEDPGPEARSSDADSWRPLKVRHTGGQVFSGWWRASCSMVRTVVSAPPSTTPLLLRFPLAPENAS